jgi:hypothetical protein
LVARGNRKGSRFAADGTPLVLRSYLESGSPGTFRSNVFFKAAPRMHVR